MHALIGREACFYECLETPEISRLATSISKRKENNINTWCDREKMWYTTFDQIKLRNHTTKREVYIEKNIAIL